MNDIITPFAYSDLPAPVAAELQVVTSRIKDRLVRQVSDIIETGRDLIEVKSKLQHGQFEAWLNLSFNMTLRTAQRFMRAAEWAKDKNDIVSHLTPTTVYMLSAKSTPEGVHEQIVERLEKGLPAEPQMIRHLIKDARIKKQSSREARDARKRRESQSEEIKNRRERQRAERRAEKQRKKTEMSERLTLAAHFSLEAKNLALILADHPDSIVTPLAKLTEAEIEKTFSDFSAIYKKLRAAIIEAHHSHSDNSTLSPPKLLGISGPTEWGSPKRLAELSKP